MLPSRAVFFAVSVWTLICPRLSVACSCQSKPSVCAQIESSAAVFIGRVNDVQPAFPRPWEVSHLAVKLTDAEEQLKEEAPPNLLAKAKQIYAELLPEPWRSRVGSVGSSGELESVLNEFDKHGIRMRLDVLEVFKGSLGQTVELRTDFASCSGWLLQGETYVVYAFRDEKGRLTTSICSSRTERLSDAGADLAYLFFQRRGGSASRRLEGFVTTSESDIENSRFHDRVSHPLANVTVQLTNRKISRYSQTGKDGRYLIDGLTPGEYDISVLEQEAFKNLLTSPHTIRVKETGCSIEPILIKRKR